MPPYEVLVPTPPFQVQQEVRRLLHGRPSAPNECRHALAQRHIHALDKGSIQLGAQTQPAQGAAERLACPTTHQMRDPHQTPPLIAFLHLPVDQPGCEMPLARPSPDTLDPLPKMGRQSIEVQIQAVAGEDREAVRGQPLMQLVDHRMGGDLVPRTGYPLGDVARG